VPALVILAVLAVAGLQWPLLGWLVWIAGFAVFVLNVGVGAGFVWVFGYPMALLFASRRGQLRASDIGVPWNARSNDDLEGHKPRTADQWTARFSRLRDTETREEIRRSLRHGRRG
jgi:hypothetical protein